MKSIYKLCIFGVALLLVSCAAERDLNREQLEALDQELKNLSGQELSKIIEEGDKDSDALAGMAGRQFISAAPADSAMRRFYDKMSIDSKAKLAETPKKVAYDRAKQIKEVKMLTSTCGDGICSPEETEIGCPKDCKFSLLKSKCFDSDGGINPAKQGAVKIRDKTGGLGQETCSTSSLLEEKYCDGDLEKTTQINCKKDGKVCNNGECVLSEEAFICGNGVCENSREIESGCSFDCGWGACGGGGDQCNEKVDVYCACQEKEFIITPLYDDGLSCSSCGKQEGLFKDFLDIQTKVYDCLAGYFKFSPPRVPNLVIFDPSEEACSNQYGCFGYEGGWSSPLGVVWEGLQGSRNYGENQPTEAEQLTADKHETTHYFLNQMIHGPPGWFTEAIAIQTNERLYCHDQENPKGDSYLKEREGDSGGVIMNDGTFLNESFYLRLKKGEAKLSEKEKVSAHIIGSLWIMGLKLEFGCTENCIRDIVLGLKSHVDQQCKISQGSCRLKRLIYLGYPKELSDEIWGRAPPLLHLWTGIDIDNSLVKKKTEELVAKDTSALFDLLGIKY